MPRRRRRIPSDRGIVAPTDRSPAGYRLYGIDAVARLDLVRTLRELGLDLSTIRRVVDRELSLPEVADLDLEFRASVRRLVEEQAAEQARSGTAVPRRDIAAAVRDRTAPALAADIDPASPQADPFVASFMAHYAQLRGRPDDFELRHRLATRLERELPGTTQRPRQSSPAGALLCCPRGAQVSRSMQSNDVPGLRKPEPVEPLTTLIFRTLYCVASELHALEGTLKTNVWLFPR